MQDVLSREQILAVARPRVVEADVPAWGGRVRLRELSVVEAATFAGQQTQDSSVTVRLLALSLCDAEGVPLFSEAEVGAFAATRGSQAMNALADAILELNALSAKAVEDVAKN